MTVYSTQQANSRRRKWQKTSKPDETWCRPWTMEQSSVTPERHRLVAERIPAVAENISVWTVGPRRSV